MTRHSLEGHISESERTHRVIAFPGGTSAENSIGSLDLRAPAEDWQKELAESKGSYAVWIDIEYASNARLGCGLVDGVEDMMLRVRPLKRKATTIPFPMVIGALDFTPIPPLRMVWLDGAEFEHARGMVASDMAWAIKDEPSRVTLFLPHRWRQLVADRRAGRFEKPATPGA